MTDRGRARQRAAAQGYLADIGSHFVATRTDDDLTQLARILDHVVARAR